MRLRQEEAQANLDALKSLWRRAMEKARKMTPEERAECRRRVDIAGSGTLTREEYLRRCGERAREEETAPVAVGLLLREAGFGTVHVEAVQTGTVARWPAVAVARAWVDQPRAEGAPLPHPCLVLCGPSDTGKTMAAAVAAARWAHRAVGPRATGQGRPLVVLRAADLTGLAPWEVQGALEEATRCRFLVLDDLGKEVATEHLRSALFGLLDARWMARKLTLISANVSPDALHSRLDWGGTAPPQGQVGPCWRRLAEGWVSTVSREKGSLRVGGVETRMPEYDKPRRQRGAP